MSSPVPTQGEFSPGPLPTPSTSSFSASYDQSSISGTTLAGSTIGSSAGSTFASTTLLSPTQENLRDLFNKRVHSFAYLKRTLSTRQSWFNTILFTPSDLGNAFDPERMRKRTTRFTVLGMSIASILEINSPNDTARAVISLINELEAIPDDAMAGSVRPKMKNFFKSSSRTLKRSALSEFDVAPGPVAGASSTTDKDNSYLIAPNVPFQLDFFQVFFTLCDVLTELYYKFLSFLSASEHQSDTTLTQELLLKADTRVRKILATQVKEIDVLARQLIKDEIAGLDWQAPAAGTGPASGGAGAGSSSFRQPSSPPPRKAVQPGHHTLTTQSAFVSHSHDAFHPITRTRSLRNNRHNPTSSSSSVDVPPSTEA